MYFLDLLSENSAEKIEISIEKITEYLLRPKSRNDKSAFLTRLGYSIEKAEELLQGIKTMAEHHKADLQRTTPFGDFYEVKGELRGKDVVAIWLYTVDTEKFRFITLFPS